MLRACPPHLSAIHLLENLRSPPILVYVFKPSYLDRRYSGGEGGKSPEVIYARAIRHLSLNDANVLCSTRSASPITALARYDNFGYPVVSYTPHMPIGCTIKVNRKKTESKWNKFSSSKWKLSRRRYPPHNTRDAKSYHFIYFKEDLFRYGFEKSVVNVVA